MSGCPCVSQSSRDVERDAVVPPRSVWHGKENPPRTGRVQVDRPTPGNKQMLLIKTRFADVARPPSSRHGGPRATQAGRQAEIRQLDITVNLLLLLL